MTDFSPLFELADEREKLRLGQPTKFPWLAKAHLPNINRDHDRTTIFIQERIIQPLQGNPQLARSLMIARMVNQIEVLPTLLPLLLDPLPYDELARRLKRVLASMPEGAFNPAFCFGLVTGRSKIDTTLALASSFDEDPSMLGCVYLETAYRNMVQRPFIGRTREKVGLLPYCIALDLHNHTANDRWTWGVLSLDAQTTLSLLTKTRKPGRGKSTREMQLQDYLPEIMAQGGTDRGWRASEVVRALWLFYRHWAMVQRGSIGEERVYAKPVV